MEKFSWQESLKQNAESKEVLPGITTTVLGKPVDYSFLNSDLDLKNNPGFRGVLDNLTKAKRIFVPFPVQSRIIKPDAFEETSVQEYAGKKIYRSKKMDADGVVLTEVGDTFIVAPGDCLTAVISYTKNNQKRVIASHLGLKSLFGNLEDSKKDWDERTLISIKEEIGDTALQEAKVYLGFSINPKDYMRDLSFPGKEDYNRQLLRELVGLQLAIPNATKFNVDLPETTKRLMILMGFSENNITIDTNTYLDNKRFWSHFNPENLTDNTKRNLMIITRTS